MDDQEIKSGQESQAEYYTGDPEVPIVPHPIPPSLDQTQTERKRDRTKNYIKAALRRNLNK